MEYIEITHLVDGKINILSKEKSDYTKRRWATDRIDIVNEFAEDGWTVVGFTDDKYLLARKVKP